MYNDIARSFSTCKTTARVTRREIILMLNILIYLRLPGLIDLLSRVCFILRTRDKWSRDLGSSDSTHLKLFSNIDPSLGVS